MITEGKLRNLARTVLKLLDRENNTLDVFLLPHREMKALKARFFKKQTEPNVLSFVEPVGFPHPEKKKENGEWRMENGWKSLSSLRRVRHSPAAERPGSALPKKKYLGEIYLNKDILRKSPDRAAPLLTHGILHLLGYDHKKKKDIIKMERHEKRILSKIDKPKIKE
ncbi:MAG: rRNA maturation RNAse YbeY [Patescibacteria group bacterium]|nr:rRNA maturation RNAse YbeY [Patescibacteria group bacterium]